MLSSAESEEKCCLGIIIGSHAQPWHNRHEKSCKTNTENMKQLTDPQMLCYVESMPPFFLLSFPVALLLTS